MPECKIRTLSIEVITFTTETVQLLKSSLKNNISCNILTGKKQSIRFEKGEVGGWFATVIEMGNAVAINKQASLHIRSMPL